MHMVIKFSLQIGSALTMSSLYKTHISLFDDQNVFWLVDALCVYLIGCFDISLISGFCVPPIPMTLSAVLLSVFYYTNIPANLWFICMLFISPVTSYEAVISVIYYTYTLIWKYNIIVLLKTLNDKCPDLSLEYFCLVRIMFFSISFLLTHLMWKKRDFMFSVDHSDW